MASATPDRQRKAFAAAVLKTQREIKPLKKSENNSYANYKFASIDQFYEEVASVACANGLTWRITEKNSTVIATGIIYTFSVTMVLEDGTEYPDYYQITVPHPIQGPQTAGSAVSYANKVFMRDVFKVVTGEPDGDHVDPAAINLKESAHIPANAKGRRKDAVRDTAKDPSDLDTFVKELYAKLPTFTSDAEMRDYWRDNIERTRRLRDIRPTVYNDIAAAYQKRRDALEKKPETNGAHASV